MSRIAWNSGLPVVAAAALIAGVTAVQGHWSGRWSGPTGPGVETLLEKTPAAIGDWDRDAGPVRIESAPAAVQYVYRRARPRATVTLFLTSGSRRELALHGPGACYPEMSLRLAVGPRRQTVAAGRLQVEVETASYWLEEPSGRRRLEALWTSRSDGLWTAGAAGRPSDRLLKLYAFTEDPLAQAEAGSLLAEFAKQLLPELEGALDSKP